MLQCKVGGKVSLDSKPYPQPYKLEWINDDGGIVVKE